MDRLSEQCLAGLPSNVKVPRCSASDISPGVVHFGVSNFHRAHQAAYIHKLPYRLLQVGSDSSQKIQQRWFPSIDDALNQHTDSSYLAFAVAIWACFVEKAVANGQLNAPKEEALSTCVTRQKPRDLPALLAIAEAEKFKFYHHQGFMEQALEYQRAITTSGISSALEVFFTSSK